MTANPLPSLARADRRQRSQNAADVSPKSPSAASPSSKPGELRPIGLALTAIIAGLPVPRDLERQ
jgi:hypothetical protein